MIAYGIYRVYGAEGHRQRESFNSSCRYNFSNEHDGRMVIHVNNCDETGTNDYTELVILRNTIQEVKDELDGQISDGLFENSRVGKVEMVTEYELA